MDLNKKQNWEEKAPLLAATGRSNPFLVPDGYFEELPEGIQARITLEEAGISKETGFTIPSGYFESLHEKVEASIALQELKEEMSNEGFVVPLGYFDDLNDRIQQRTQAQAPVRTVRFVPKWINYAAAAVVTIAATFGVLMFSNSNSFESRLSEVPDQEIVNYLQMYSDQTDVQVIVENLEVKNSLGVTDNISEQELRQYLEETSL